MAAAAAVVSTTPHSAVADLRRSLDTLDSVSAALNSVRDLLIPEEGLGSVDRNNLAMLFGVLEDAAKETDTDASDWKGMSASAMQAVADLVSPSKDLHCVSRDHLCALVDLLAHMQAGAVASAWQAMKRVGE